MLLSPTRRSLEQRRLTQARLASINKETAWSSFEGALFDHSRTAQTGDHFTPQNRTRYPYPALLYELEQAGELPVVHFEERILIAQELSRLVERLSGEGAPIRRIELEVHNLLKRRYHLDFPSHGPALAHWIAHQPREQQPIGSKLLWNLGIGENLSTDGLNQDDITRRHKFRSDGVSHSLQQGITTGKIFPEEFDGKTFVKTDKPIDKATRDKLAEALCELTRHAQKHNYSPETFIRLVKRTCRDMGVNAHAAFEGVEASHHPLYQKQASDSASPREASVTETPRQRRSRNPFRRPENEGRRRPFTRRRRNSGANRSGTSGPGRSRTRPRPSRPAGRAAGRTGRYTARRTVVGFMAALAGLVSIVAPNGPLQADASHHAQPSASASANANTGHTDQQHKTEARQQHPGSTTGRGHTAPPPKTTLSDDFKNMGVTENNGEYTFHMKNKSNPWKEAYKIAKQANPKLSTEDANFAASVISDIIVEENGIDPNDIKSGQSIKVNKLLGENKKDFDLSSAVNKDSSKKFSSESIKRITKLLKR